MTEQQPAPVSRGATLDWAWDWTDWLLAGDSITSHLIAPGTGLTVVGTSTRSGATVSGQLAVASDLAIGTRLSVACTVSTAAGLTDSRTIHMQVARR